MNKYFEKFHINKLLLVFSILLFCLIFYVVMKMLTNTYITIQFDELAPFERSMPVYYKGFKVGRTRNIKPSKDFKKTFVEVVIDYKNLKLPKNTVAWVKKIDKGENGGRFDYIELKYPDAPSIYYLKTGSYIDGKTSLDWNTLLSQQADKGSLDDISEGVGGLIDSLKDTSDSLNSIFQTVNEILVENKSNIMASTSNLSKTTNNLREVSAKINNSISQDGMNNTTSSAEDTFENIAGATKNLEEVSANLNQMMPYIDATIMDVNSTMCNVNQISKGILETLQKRMGLMKLLIGKPVDKKKCCP